MSRLIDRVLSLPKWVVVTTALLLIGLIGVADYVSGHDFSLSPFYRIPIGWTCWVVGRRAGVLLSAISSVVWLVADMLTGYLYSHRSFLYWSALVLLALFVCVVYLLAAFKAANALKQELVGRKRIEETRLHVERLATVSTMAAQVAHEVRNPLGSVTLNLDLVDKEISKLAESSGHRPEEGLALLQEIRGEVRRIRHVIDDYLQFARLPKPQKRPPRR